jgi:MFS family permease
VEIPPAFRAAAFTAFFLSGFAALVYQVVWQRMLVAFSGADVYSSTVIIAAFMAGLGIGNLGGGHIADRLPRRKALILFAVAEACIAIFSVLSRRLYYDFLYQALGGYAIGRLLLTAILFTSLLWPTSSWGVAASREGCHGLSGRRPRDDRRFTPSTRWGRAGRIVMTWWVRRRRPRWQPQGRRRPQLALRGARPALCAAGGGRSRKRDHRRSSTAGALSAGGRALPFAVWAAVYALSGLIALSLEIVWFRLLGVMMKSTALPSVRC